MSLLLTNAIFGGDLKGVERIAFPLPRELSIYSAAFHQAGIKHTRYDTLLIKNDAFKEYLFTQRFERICLHIPEGCIDKAINLISFIKQTEELKNTSIICLGLGVNKYENVLFDAGVSIILHDGNEHSLVHLINTLQTPFNPFLDEVKGITFRNVLGNLIKQPDGEYVPRTFAPDYSGISLDRYLKNTNTYIIPIDKKNGEFYTGPEEAQIEKQHVESIYQLDCWIYIADPFLYLQKLAFLPKSQAGFLEKIMVNVSQKPDMGVMMQAGCKRMQLLVSPESFIEWMNGGYPELQNNLAVQYGTELTWNICIKDQPIDYEIMKPLYDWFIARPMVKIKFSVHADLLTELYGSTNEKLMKKYIKLQQKINHISAFVHAKQQLNSYSGKWKNLKPAYHLARIRAAIESFNIP
ncbi:MAG: hypothetical protein N2167_07940 [Flavobacteriales bacterium]|nr:hypothetical protein [Flavobacteriales bacterium]